MTHFVVAGHLLGTEPSGAGRRTLAILRELPGLLRPGERITLLYGTALPDGAHIDGIGQHAAPLPAAPSWRRALAERRHLARLLATLEADVADLGALPVPPRLPCPVTLTVHDLRDLEPGLARRPPWLARTVLRRAVDRATHIIAPSRFTARRLAEVRTPRALTVIPGGVDPELLAIEPRPASGRRYFLHVGHLERRKDLGTLLAAYSRYRTRAQIASPPTLVLVGADHGEGRGLRRQAHELGVAPDVRFAGVVADTVLHTLYAGATAVAVPSLHEGFGLPALEALAVGVPVLIANAGASPEVAGTVGEVLPAGDIDAWAQALEAATTRGFAPIDVERRKAHARSFTWRRAAQATLTVWRASAR